MVRVSATIVTVALLSVPVIALSEENYVYAPMVFLI